MELVMKKIYDIGDVPRREALADRFMFPFSQVNFLLNGGIFDRVTLIASGTDNGKTTFTSQIICDIVKQGFKCACFFGEDTAYESQERLYMQATYGKDEDNIVYVPYMANGKATNCGEFVLSNKAWNEAHNKFKGKVWLYNTNASATVEDILDGFEEARVQHGCKVFVLDNCDQFEFTSDNENKAMREIVIKIRDYAINKKVHIFLISHIRKTERDVILPNIFDIKGSSSLGNIAKNVIILVRLDKVNRETPQYKTLKELLRVNNYDLDEADSLVHIAKTKGRKIGFACLKFNKKTNTYYDCPKIDESQEEDDKARVVSPYKDLIPIDNAEDVFGNINF